MDDLRAHGRSLKKGTPIDLTTHMKDGWNNPVLVQQTINEELSAKLQRTIIEQLIVRCYGSDIDELDDDIIYILSLSDSGNWTWAKGEIKEIKSNGQWIVKKI